MTKRGRPRKRHISEEWKRKIGEAQKERWKRGRAKEEVRQPVGKTVEQHEQINLHIKKTTAAWLVFLAVFGLATIGFMSYILPYAGTERTITLSADVMSALVLLAGGIIADVFVLAAGALRNRFRQTLGGVLGGVLVGVLFGVLVGVLFGVLFGVLGGVLGGVAVGVLFGVLSDQTDEEYEARHGKIF